MNCGDARSVIVLRESDDATRRELRDLDSHLDSCGECRDFASSLRHLPLDGIRGELPLCDDDFAEIRRSVMATVTARPRPARRRTLLAFALGAAAIVALLAVGVSYVRRARAPERVEIASTTPPARAVVPPPEPPRPVVSPPTHPAPVVVAPKTAPRRIHHRPSRPKTPEVALASLPPAARAEPVRIEIQTKDPNVRIIWISQQPQTTSSSAVPEGVSDSR